QPPLFPPTYTWSGIGSITPVFKFTATTSGTTTILASNTTTVKYDTDPLAPGDGYDTTTYQWTSDVNRTNSVTITNQYDVMSGSQFNVNVYVNGVFVVGEYHGVYGSTATVTITSVFNNILLNIGDVIEVKISNTFNPNNLFVHNGSWTLSSIPNSSSAVVNHLLKKLFQF